MNATIQRPIDSPLGKRRNVDDYNTTTTDDDNNNFAVIGSLNNEVKRKRNLEDGLKEAAPSPCKLFRPSYYVTLADDDEDKDESAVVNSDSDDYGAINNRETDICKDSDEDETDVGDSSDNDSHYGVIEFDVASMSDSSNSFYSGDSSSGAEDIVLAAVAAHAFYYNSDEDSSSEADFSDDSVATFCDPDFKRADYWKCVKCNNAQNNPMYRYCEKCYRLRKSHFPPRPKSTNGKTKKRKPRKFRKRERTLSTSVTSSEDEDSTPEDLTKAVNSGGENGEGEREEKEEEIKSLQGEGSSSSENGEGDAAQRSKMGILSERRRKKRSLSVDKEEESTSPSSSQLLSGASPSQDEINCNLLDSSYSNERSSSLRQTASNLTSREFASQNVMSCLKEIEEERAFSDSEVSRRKKVPKLEAADSGHEILSKVEDVCVVCLDKPKDTAFVHPNRIHVCCCYDCAKIIFNKQMGCPICKRKFNQFLKIFFA